MDGQFQMTDMGNMTSEHRDVMDNFIACVRMQLKNSLCFSMREAKYLWPEADGRKYEPDISILCGARKKKGLSYTDCPRFIAEVLSNTTEKDDRGAKMELYLKVGVQEYWLIDPRNLTVERYMMSDDETEYLLHDIICESSEPSVKNSLHLLTFPMVTVSWENLFYGIREEI